MTPGKRVKHKVTIITDAGTGIGEAIRADDLAASAPVAPGESGVPSFGRVIRGEGF